MRSAATAAKASGILLIATAALVFGLARPAHAAAANVVPNPGFEQGGCGGNTPDVCGWKLVDGSSGTCTPTGPCSATTMYQDTTNTRTGGASLYVSWGTNFSTGVGVVEAEIDPAFCVAIGPGAHPASFWYDAIANSDGNAAAVEMDATFFQGAGCTGAGSSASLSDSVNGVAWRQVTGVLVAPQGTQSALFAVGASTYCDYASGCSVSANFDDLDVEDTVLTTPAITSFTPASGPAGTNVDIRGANFSGATSVAFDGASAAFTVDSDSEIHATVPKGATTGPISVTTANGTGTSSASFGVAPTINSFTPTCGPAGATVDILGSGFAAATSVTFTSAVYGSQPASFTVDSDSEIHAIVPSAATFGPIAVGTPGGASASSSSFTGPCNSPPEVDSLTPNSGPVGTSVDIRGHYFTGTTSVKFNGTAAAFTVDSDSEMHATAPSGATTGPVSVTTQNGTTWNLSFTVTPSPPTIGSFAPANGAVGTSVDIKGTSFTNATNVKFNGTSDPSFVVNSSTDVTAHVPSGATTGPISVTTPTGTGTSSSSFTVTTSPPTITSFTPTSGPVGTSVDIQGTNFTGATSVSFNGTDASFVANSSTNITAHVPTGATTGPISVTTPSGSASSTAFTVVKAPPTITSFAPSSGHSGQQVTINGSNFAGATSVKLGKVSSNFTVNSSSTIATTVPTMKRGLYHWSVTTPAGTATSIGSFLVS